MKKKTVVAYLLAAIIFIAGYVVISTNFFKVYPLDSVRDESSAIRIATETLGPSAKDYPIVSAKSEADNWVVTFSGENTTGGVEIRVNKFNSETGAIMYLP